MALPEELSICQPNLFPDDLNLRFELLQFPSLLRHDQIRLEIGGGAWCWELLDPVSLDPGVEGRAVLGDGGDGDDERVVWDAGRWSVMDGNRRLTEEEILEQVKSGCLEFQIEGERLMGGFRLSHGWEDEWTLRKIPDGYCQYRHQWNDDRSVLSGGV